MKKKLASHSTSAAFLFLGIAGGAFAASNAVLVPAPIEKVFVPLGFDDNDKVEAIVHGEFPSSCYKMGPAVATVDAVGKKIVINAQAYYYPGAVCVSMMVPFIKSVELPGLMAPGVYEVSIAGNAELKPTSLTIGRALTPEPDDHLYAAVTSVDVVQSLVGESEIILRGQHPHVFVGCVKFVSVRTYGSPGNVVVVQPITRIASSEECAVDVTEDSRFEERVKLPGLTQGEYVLHVRALDGNAVNRFVRVE